MVIFLLNLPFFWTESRSHNRYAYKRLSSHGINIFNEYLVFPNTYYIKLMDILLFLKYIAKDKRRRNNREALYTQGTHFLSPQKIVDGYSS